MAGKNSFADRTPTAKRHRHLLDDMLAEINAYRFGLRGETFNAYGAPRLLQGVPEGLRQVIDHASAATVMRPLYL